MPDYLFFFAERDFVDRFDRIAADTLDLIKMVDGAHLMVIATFKMARQGYPVLKDLAMMPVTKEWLPFEIIRDVEVIDTLVSQRRSFQKSKRYNLLTKAPIASAILTDLAELMALFVPNPQSDGDTLQELMTTAHGGRYTHQIWLPNSQMPDLPVECKQSATESRWFCPPRQQVGGQKPTETTNQKAV